MSTIELDEFRKLLEVEQARLVKTVKFLHDENPGTLAEDAGEETAYDNHLADTATETYDRELDYTLEENSEHVLADIDAALKRIEEGTYGISEVSGRPIPMERLEAVPWATTLVDEDPPDDV